MSKPTKLFIPIYHNNCNYAFDYDESFSEFAFKSIEELEAHIAKEGYVPDGTDLVDNPVYINHSKQKYMLDHVYIHEVTIRD